MFKYWIFCFFVPFIFVIDGRQFRFDYKYDSSVDGWLKLHRIPAKWHDARLRCHLEGAMLASPVNLKMLMAMKNLMLFAEVPPCGVFTGIHATFSKGDYSSIDGVHISRIPITWAPDEPDNFEDSENCLMLLSNGTMADVKCTDVFPYICYKKKTKGMLVTSCGTNDKEYELDQRTGSCYKFYSVQQTWNQAYSTCLAVNGHLVIINSDDEAQITKELFSKNTNRIKTISGHTHKDAAHIGFHDWNVHGTWLTIHGQTLDEAGYNKWGSNLPNNATPGEFCGSVLPSGLLNDVWCHEKFPFICEKSPDSLVDEDN